MGISSSDGASAGQPVKVHKVIMITASTIIPGILAMLACQAPPFHTTVEMVPTLLPFNTYMIMSLHNALQPPRGIRSEQLL